VGGLRYPRSVGFVVVIGMLSILPVDVECEEILMMWHSPSMRQPIAYSSRRHGTAISQHIDVFFGGQDVFVVYAPYDSPTTEGTEHLSHIIRPQLPDPLSEKKSQVIRSDQVIKKFKGVRHGRDIVVRASFLGPRNARNDPPRTLSSLGAQVLPTLQIVDHAF
jgi:hypothetical protein